MVRGWGAWMRCLGSAAGCPSHWQARIINTRSSFLQPSRSLEASHSFPQIEFSRQSQYFYRHPSSSELPIYNHLATLTREVSSKASRWNLTPIFGSTDWSIYHGTAGSSGLHLPIEIGFQGSRAGSCGGLPYINRLRTSNCHHPTLHNHSYPNGIIRSPHQIRLRPLHSAYPLHSTHPCRSRNQPNPIRLATFAFDDL